MAVRFSAIGQHYSATTFVPDEPLTIALWAKITTDRNAVSGLWGVAGGDSISMSTISNGTTMQVVSSAPTSVGAFAMTPGSWYKLAFTSQSGDDVFYHGALNSALTSDTATIGNITSQTAFYLGCSVTTSEWFNGCIANVKVWNEILSPDELEREFAQYVPHRKRNLERWHPLLNAETVDYSGNAATLIGGTGTTTEDGPPIPWRLRHRESMYIPPDPASQVWYAIYLISTGALYSTGDTYELAAGMAVKQYIGAYVDLSAYTWDEIALDFVPREGQDPIDRVQDLVADPALSAVWADLSPANATILKDYLAVFLDHHRWRTAAETVGL